MKFGVRKPSFNKRIAARTSVSRYVRHNLGFKAPRGYGWITNPKKAAYNRVYNRTSFSLGKGGSGLEGLALLAVFGIIILLFKGLFYLVGQIISQFRKPQPASLSLYVSEDGEGEPSGAEKFSGTVQAQEDNPLCPHCSEAMVRRVARRGRNAGNEFWGCSQFPRCRGTRAA